MEEELADNTCVKADRAWATVELIDCGVLVGLKFVVGILEPV